MPRLRILGAILLIVAVLAIALPGTAAAQFPPTPYRCTVFIDGAPAPAGTTVEAYMGGMLRDTETTGQPGFDANVCIVMVAGGEGDLGKDVSFVAHGEPATETPDIAYTLVPQEVRLDVAGVVIWAFPHGLSQNPIAILIRHYDGAEVSLPTGTEPEQVLVGWHYDETQMDWFFYVPGWESTLTALEYCKTYIVIVSDACEWEIPQS